VDGSTASAGDPSTADMLGGWLNVLQHHPDNSEKPYPSILVVRGNKPVNEIANTDVLFYYNFSASVYTWKRVARGLYDHTTQVNFAPLFTISLSICARVTFLFRVKTVNKQCWSV
jgi:hypothetical protein